MKCLYESPRSVLQGSVRYKSSGLRRRVDLETIADVSEQPGDTIFRFSGEVLSETSVTSTSRLI
jgi:hypothetical protein